MKKIILAAAMLVAINSITTAQNVGIGTTTPNASALLDVNANNKGVLIPRLTNAQMIAIATPANGLLVYNTDSAAFAYRTASAWVFLKGNATASNDWSTKGNAGTDTSKNFIGTTDDVDVIFKRNNEQAGWLNETLKNTSLGAGSLSNATTGFNNTATGYRALKNNSIGYNNTAIGSQALGSNNIGSRNTATGLGALFSNISGNENAANGTQALLNNIDGSSNIARGFQSLFSNGSGFSNVAIGAKALYSNTNSSNLVAIGDSALYNNGTGAIADQPIQNTAVGSKALYSNTIGYRNTANGYQALYSNNVGYSNTANGSQALYKNEGGISNTANGDNALYSNITGNQNTANGTQALYSNITGNQNTANGDQALYRNNSGLNNTAIGQTALFSNSTGSSNTATGTGALLSNGTGYSNVAMGADALHENTSRSNLVAIGDSALYNNGIGATDLSHSTGNTATGSKALFSNTIGQSNTANGFQALFSNSSGDFNTANGNQALSHNSTGNSNTANGYQALSDNSTGNSNTANGVQALLSNTSGFENTVVGYAAMINNTTGNFNTSVGNNAGFANSNGSGNVFLGYSAGRNETGSNKLYISNNNTDAANTLIYGEFNNKILSIGGKLGIGTTAPHGDLQLPNMLANRKIVMLEDANNDNQYNGFGVNAFILRYQAAATTSSHVFYAGTSPTTSNELMRITGNGEVGVGKVPLTSNNDSRLQIKQKGTQNGIGVEAADNTNHWDFYTNNTAASNFLLYYNGAYKGAFDNVTGAYTAASDRRLKKDITPQQAVLNDVMQLQAYQYHYLDNQPTDRFSNGFMAQDVQKIFPDAVVENEMKDGEKRLGINYQYFTVLAIKGLQEQQKQIQSQEERIAKLEALVKTLVDKK